MKHRYINFRAFLIMTPAVICCIIACSLIKIYGMVSLILLATLFVVLIVAFIVSIKRKYKKHIMVSLVLSFIFCIAAIINFNFILNSWHDSTIDGKSVISIKSTVDMVKTENGNYEILAKNIYANNKKVKGKIVINIDGTNDTLRFVKPGDKLEFSETVFRNNLIDNNKVFAHLVRNNTRYRCYVASNNIKFTPKQADFLTRFRQNMKAILIDAMGEEYGNLAHGMIVGDASGINDDTITAFNISGLAHLLSVSGLHIGFIAIIMTFLFKKLRLPNKISAIFSLLFFVFYLFLANFSPSVLRAVIMFEIISLSQVFGKRYDPLSSLLFSALVILLIQPFYLFEAGFILSMSAVFGIITLTVPITLFLKKIKTPLFLRKPLSVSLSVQIAIIPPMMYLFNLIQVYSILANVVLMPLMGFSFVLILSMLIVTLIIPFLIVLLKISGITLVALSDASNIISDLPHALLYCNPTLLVFLCYPLYFLMGNFYMSKYKISPIKIISCVLSIAIIVTGFSAFNRIQASYYFVPINSYGEVTTLVKDKDRTYFIGDFNNYYGASRAVILSGNTSIDAIFLNDLSIETADALVKFSKMFNVSKIYCQSSAKLDGLQRLIEAEIDNFYLIEKGEFIDDRIGMVYENDKFLAYELHSKDINILFCASNISYNKMDFEVLNRCSIIRTKLYLNDIPDRIYITNIYKGFLGEIPQNQYSTAELGEFAFDYEFGKIYR